MPLLRLGTAARSRQRGEYQEVKKRFRSRMHSMVWRMVLCKVPCKATDDEGELAAAGLAVARAGAVSSKLLRRA